jgi:hypothetical protein
MWEDLGEIRTGRGATPDGRPGVGHAIVAALIEQGRELGLRRIFVLTFEEHFFAGHGFAEIDGTPVPPDVFAAMLRSYDAGVAEFLDLAHVKPNTLGNVRMLTSDGPSTDDEAGSGHGPIRHGAVGGGGSRPADRLLRNGPTMSSGNGKTTVRVLVGAEFQQGLQVAQLQRRGVRAEDVRGLPQLPRRLQLPSSVDDLGSALPLPPRPPWPSPAAWPRGSRRP